MEPRHHTTRLPLTCQHTLYDENQENDGFLFVNHAQIKNGGASLFHDEITNRVPLAKATLFEAPAQLKHESEMDAIEYENSVDFDGYSVISKQEELTAKTQSQIRGVIRMPKVVETPPQLIISKPVTIDSWEV